VSVPGAHLAVQLDRRDALPGDEIGVIVHVEESLDRVRSASVELGYLNVFRYRWAGHRDSMAATVTETITLLDPGAVGTTQGGDRETKEWVSVLDQPLECLDGRLPAGPHRTTFRLPSWSPASSPALARWAVRTRVDRERALDVVADAELTVLAPHPATDPGQLEQRRLKGDAADVDVHLDEPGARPGGHVRGRVAVTARRSVKPADVLVFLFRDRLSHPVSRRPGEGECAWRTRERLAKKHQLVPNVAVELPFALEVPTDAEPTAETPNASIRWYVEASVSYRGWTGDVADRVRREVIVFNGP
jgi:hypothetical protein